MPAADAGGLTRSTSSSQGGFNRLAARAGSILFGAVALVLYQTAFWLPSVPLTAKVGLGVYGVLALCRPSQGLLIVAGLTPLAAVLWPPLGLTPTRGAEALALAVVAGWYLKGGAGRDGSSDPLTARVSLLFGLTVVGAWLVIFTPEALTWSGPQTRTASLVRFFATRYLGPASPDGLWACGLLVVSLALSYATLAMSRRDGLLAQRLVRMTIAGGMGAAGLSFFRIGAALVRSPDRSDLLERLVSGQIRLSLHVPDVNAAGSYFVLIAVLALGIAVMARRAWPWLTAWGIAVLALLISGSRSALFAGAAVTIAGLALVTWRRLPAFRHPATLVAGVALSIIVFLAAVAQPGAGTDAASSLRIRYYFAETSVRMIASSPVFGVGLNRYVTRSSQFMPRQLGRLYRRENAHNHFLQMTAELGLVGGLLFSVLVFVPIVRGIRAIRAGADVPALAGVTGGLTAFAITCLSGHPLLHAQVAYPFWILLGLASGLALGARDRAAGTSGVPAAPSRMTPVATWAAATIAILLAISVPIRVHSAARNTIFSQVEFGFHDWETDPGGRRFRWTSGSATFYIPTGVRTLDIPVRAWTPTRERPTSVEIDVNGRRVSLHTLDHARWTSVQVKLPPRAPDRFWQIDLRVRPVARPSEMDPKATDDRVLGVRVGEFQLTPDPDTREPANRSLR